MVLGFVARWATLAAILAVGGAATFRMIVLRRAALARDAFMRASRRAADVGLIAAIVLVPAAFVRLALQTAAMRFPDDPWVGVATQLVVSTEWGTIWLMQIAAAILLIVAFACARRGSAFAWWAVAIFAVMLLVTPTLSSHAMSAEGRRWLSVPADVLHVGGASVWLGTLGVMFATANIAGGDESREGEYVASLLPAFSPLALIGATLVASSGVVSSLVHFDHPLSALGSRYGQVLGVKLAAVLVVVILGWRNWKRLTPALRASGSAPIWRGMRAELIATAVVLLLTAALIVTPPPIDAMSMP
jgi:copper transport protein